MTESENKKKKMPAECVELVFAGDLIMAKCASSEFAGMFRRFEALFEYLANMDKDARLLNYKFLNGLMLTSHAKKVPDKDKRRELFELKNKIYFDIANNPNTRRKVAFRYLTTNHARQIDEKQVDKDYFNILSMHHKFNSGSATLYLSNDRINNIPNIRLNNKGRLSEHKEEMCYIQYRYNVRNLNSIKLDSVLKMHQKLQIKP